MAGDDQTIGVDAQEVSQRASYERSLVGFPYFDLGEAVRIAKAISDNVAGGDCSDDQLGPWLKLSPKSSGYRSRISAARMFGLLEPGVAKDHRLSELGIRVLDQAQGRAAKAEAFLRVPLFKRVFEQCKGLQLPPPAALERAMAQMGVADKLTARARQVMERSAAEGGYFEHGRDRLVPPGIKDGEAGGQKKKKKDDGGSGGGGGGDDDQPHKLDPIIEGLLKRLPKAGDVWPEAERGVWLDLLKGSFTLIYKSSPKN